MADTTTYINAHPIKLVDNGDGTYSFGVSNGESAVTVIDLPNDTLIQGNKTLTGAADQVHTDTSCKVVTIQAHPANTGYVYIGKSTVSDTVHMAVLSPGSSMTFTVSNVNKLYAYGTANDKISFGGEV